MRAKFSLGLVLAGLLLGWQAYGQEYRGIVSLEVTNRAVDTHAPWNRRNEGIIHGNAVVVDQGLLLTTSDMVKNATLIQARAFGRYPDYQAQLLLVDYELDLALLTVKDPAFWRGLQPMALAENPLASGRFLINRWRTNGRFEQGSGEVVEVLMGTSRYGRMELPTLKGNTNMSGLGWSEVLTVDGRLMGLLTSHTRQVVSANPSTLVNAFIKAALRPGEYRGFGHRGFSWQRMNQPDLQRYFGLREGAPGILVREVLPSGTGAGELKPDDILMKLGGYEIDPEGFITHPQYGRLNFAYAINQGLGGSLAATVLRKGKLLELNIKKRRFTGADDRIPLYQFDQPVDYEVFGGLVVEELSLDFLRAWGDNWQKKAPTRLMLEFSMHSLRSGKLGERVLVVAKVLPHAANLGYEPAENAIVVKANGQPVHTLAEFRQAVAKDLEGYHYLELLPGMGRAKLVFDAARLNQANGEIRQKYDIPARGPSEKGPVKP